MRPLHDLRRKKKKKACRLNYSAELSQPIPYEPIHVTEAKWKAVLASLYRFVDDSFSLSVINFENSCGFCVNGEHYRSKHTVQAQNIFRHLVRRAEEIGMRVNTQKTAMICVSDSTSLQAGSFILDAEGTRIACQDKINALAMIFVSRPNMDLQVKHMGKKMRQRLWTLRNLKKNGFSEEE